MKSVISLTKRSWFGT